MLSILNGVLGLFVVVSNKPIELHQVYLIWSKVLESDCIISGVNARGERVLSNRLKSHHPINGGDNSLATTITGEHYLLIGHVTRMIANDPCYRHIRQKIDPATAQLLGKFSSPLEARRNARELERKRDKTKK